MVSAGEPKKVSKKIVAPVFSFARRKTGPQGIQDISLMRYIYIKLEAKEERGIEKI